jgi:hypothetical protein
MTNGLPLIAVPFSATATEQSALVIVPWVTASTSTTWQRNGTRMYDATGEPPMLEQ